MVDKPKQRWQKVEDTMDDLEQLLQSSNGELWVEFYSGPQMQEMWRNGGDEPGIRVRLGLLHSVFGIVTAGNASCSCCNRPIDTPGDLAMICLAMADEPTVGALVLSGHICMACAANGIEHIREKLSEHFAEVTGYDSKITPVMLN